MVPFLSVQFLEFRQMAKTVLGIIGGSGVYDMDGLENKEWRKVESPWGAPSSTWWRT